MVDEEEPDEGADRAERRQALLDERHERLDLVVRWHPVDVPGIGLRRQERPQPLHELLGLQAPDPLAVEPLQALAIEDRATLLDVLDVEAGGQLLE